MACFLDTDVFSILLSEVAGNGLPAEILADSLLSPVTALECAQSKEQLPILTRYRAYLRPLRSRLLMEPEGYSQFLEHLETEEPDFFAEMLDIFYAQSITDPSFLNFHLSRYSQEDRERLGIQGILATTNYQTDVRDSMQLIVSQEILFITGDKMRDKTIPPACQVVPVELDVPSILDAIRIVNAGLTRSG
jgi:hypothetical protein